MDKATPTRREQRRPEQRRPEQRRPEQREGRRPAPQQVPGRKPAPARVSSGEIHTSEPQPAAPSKRAPGRKPQPRNQRPENPPRGQAAPRRRPPRPSDADQPAPGTKAPGKKAPGKKAPGNKAPGNKAASKKTANKPQPAKQRAADPPTPPPPASGSRGSFFGGNGGGRKTAHRVGQAAVTLLSIAVLVVGGYSWRSATGVTGAITQLKGLSLGGGQDGAVDLLLVGTDSRTDAKGVPLTTRELRWLRSGDETATNTDTILLIRIPNNGSSATAISIPRDAYVDVPGIGMSKINAAYGATKEQVRRTAVEKGGNPDKAERDGTQAGREALINTVAKLTGVDVDHYAEIGLLGFALLTNAVGGVEVCLKAPVRERFSGAKFRKGRQTLNGPQALSFVRQRHGLPRGDLDRITRQQVFMASLASKMLSAKVLTDPTTMGKLQTAVSRSVVIDDNWDILAFAEKLRDLSGGKVKFATIPIVTEEGWSQEGQSIVKVDPKSVHAFTEQLLNGDEPKKRGGGKESYTVDVVNAGTIDGMAANVSNILTAKGFGTGKTSTKPMNERDSIIFAHDADDSTAKQLSSALGGIAIRADQSLPTRQIRVVLTNTYFGPGSIMDTGPQPEAQRVADTKRQAAARAGSARAPITAANTGGPMCVN